MKELIKINRKFYRAKPVCDKQCCFKFNNVCNLGKEHFCNIDCQKGGFIEITNPFEDPLLKQKLKKVYDIIKNTQVNDGMSYDEQEMITYCLKDIDNIEFNIINNRMLFNKTFAIRLYHFLITLETVDDNNNKIGFFSFLDPTKKQSKELIDTIEFSRNLFNYQLVTCTDDDEIKYMKNINQMTAAGIPCLLD